MHKNIIIIASLLTTLAYGMEIRQPISLVKITTNSLTLQCNKTYFHLTKKPLSQVEHKTNRTIIGHNQHALTKEKCDTYAVGTIYEEPLFLSQTSTINDNDNNSKNNANKQYIYNPKISFEDNFRKMTQSVTIVTEPCITQSDEDFVYNVCRTNPNHNTIACAYNHNGPKISIDLCQTPETILLQFTGDKAIQEASKDLSLCYRKILRFLAGYQAFASHPDARYERPLQFKNINIAISALSADAGFPQDKAAPIAIETIFNFLKEYPDGYDHIYLVAQELSIFEFYIKALLKHYTPIAIPFLYWMHKDKEIVISNLPYETLNHIASFMCNLQTFKHIQKDVL